MSGQTDPDATTNDSWLTQLQQLREADATQQQAQELRQTQRERSVSLMRQSRAHVLLRQVQKALLGGEGAIKVYENVEGYDQVFVLMWQGPISSAREPDRVEEPYSYILVGVKEGQVWVNGQALPKPDPEAMKAALLQASKAPLQGYAKGVVDKKKQKR